MAYKGREAKLSYDFVAALPASDPDLKYFNRFKAMFGDDGAVMVIGLSDKKVFELDNFIKLQYLTRELQNLKGITQVLSLPQMQYLDKDTSGKKFLAKKIFPKTPQSQRELDSLLRFSFNQKIYHKLLFNTESNALLIVVGIEKEILNSHRRQRLMKDILDVGEAFSQKTNIQLHYGGLPFVRAVSTEKVSQELSRLLILSGIATSLILFYFFRTIVAIIVPILIIGIGVIWCFGFLGIFGYKITLLTGLLPPLLVVIGVPNCVYLLNKYHQEYRKYNDKHKALLKIIQKIGIVTFMTNTTTAIGFGVFIFMDNINLSQFGVVSFLCVMSTFVISIVLIPIIYSFLPAPNQKHLKHLDRKQLSYLLNFLDKIVFQYKWATYAIVCIISILSVIGIYQLQAVSFMVDNVPDNSLPKKDLAFFEKHFSGVMPLEIVIDTQRKKGAMNLKNLRKVEDFENSLQEIAAIARPLSLVSLVKTTKQAYYNQKPEFYELPSNQDAILILNYLQKSDSDSTSKQLLNNLVDSTGRYVRISLKVADIGSQKLDALVNQKIQPKIDSTFKDTKLKATVTGSTLLFIKGNVYLIDSLQSSLLLAIGLIALIMATLFGSLRMIVISIITNLLPLAITAAMMGYLGIPLKPSSALIFSIAFGIAVDDSIHYLARYRQELILHHYSVANAVRVSLRETGGGMFYTSIVLFFGFIVFLYSDFEGTIVLGILTSTTLLMAMFANLIVLPTLLLQFDSGKYDKRVKQLIDYYDEDFIYEEDDEEIDLSLLKVAKKSEDA
jgi:hypothetical protein